VKKDLEDTRRQTLEGGTHLEVTQVGRPRGSPVSLGLHTLCSTALGFQSPPLFQVGLIKGLWFIPPAYINRAHPPPEERSQREN
jgi:hypothetical protein